MSEKDAKYYDLAQNPIEQLFFHLLKSRFVGVVEVNQGPPHAGKRSIYWRGGLAVYTDWVSRPDALGELYVLRQFLSADQLNAALQERQLTREKLGQVLRKKGWSDEATLTSMLAWQCTRKLRFCFSCRSGRVAVREFEHGLGVDDDLKGQVNTLGLLWTGIFANVESAAMIAKMGDAARAKLCLSPAAERYLPHFGLGREDEALLAQIRRGFVAAEHMGGGNSRKALALLYTLWNCEMLLQDGQAVIPPPLAEAKSSIIDSGIRPSQTTSVPRPGSALRFGATGSRPATVSPPPIASAVPRPSVAPRGEKTPSSPPRPNPAGSFLQAPTSTSASVPAPSMQGSVGGETPAAAAASAEPARAKSASASKSTSRRGAAVLRPASADFVAALESFEAKIKNGDHAFALFDLGIEADRDAIRVRWAALSRELHPDSLASRGLDEFRPRVQRVFSEISAAYSTLSNKEQRELLRTALSMGSKVTGRASASSQAAEIVRQTVQAEAHFRDAERLIKKNAFARALELYETGLAVIEKDAGARAGAAWCRYQVAQRTNEAATKAAAELSVVTQEAPACADAWYYLGQIQSQLGKNEMALASLEKACAANPRHLDAQRHLRVVQNQINQAKSSAKVESTQSGRSRLGGLFGGSKR
jgi:tetratricopeptide (TPR) repeat protein